MKAFIVDRYKQREPLRFGDMPMPIVQVDDLLVEVHAASVNPSDSKLRDGEFKPVLPARNRQPSVGGKRSSRFSEETLDQQEANGIGLRQLNLRRKR